MLASVLNSAIAVRSSVYVVRAFVKMRSCLAEYAGLAHRLDRLGEKYDGRFSAVFEAIRQLMAALERPQRSIGFLRPGRPDRKT